MNLFKSVLVVVTCLTLTNCASRYKPLNPSTVNYVSQTENKNLKLEYRYSLLEKKYAKKEIKKGVKLVALKVTNNSDKTIVFGQDATLNYANGTPVTILNTEETFKSLKQHSALYLLYLLLTPVNFYTYETNSYGVQETTSSTPVGLVLGPGIAAGNVILASSSNKKFKNELQQNEIIGMTIQPGETKFGLIGLKSFTYDSLKLKVN
ncbi:hypothetical protein [Aestuariibaculum sediminum]|uniref:Uncharacterized protein n=1 Tax=Aestuariibaculum sediminum TaxID=2770637 RepID=A0A8J6UBD8_9FLAO|nr:hypothetical protein [Aestuariibaculum sediminum]MBD0830609.1 hypothetical protein [Aestuariibaculum sediminum]